jgi:hypothetical protein
MAIGLSQSEIATLIRTWIGEGDTNLIARAVGKAIEENNQKLERDIKRLIATLAD